MTVFAFSRRAAAAPFALAGAFSFLCSAAWAQNVSLGTTVITATRSASRADELVSDVTVIDRQTIEAAAARTLPELLARTAGVQLSANGGLGKTSGVFIRGTESRHTILLVDGVRLSSATVGTPSWDSIPVDMIERIEVLKGPASALYGSEGVGGVVQIFLRHGQQGFHPNAALTLGSKKYVRAAVGWQGGQGGLNYSLGVQRLRERGFSATNERVPFGSFNPDSDPFEQNAVNATVDYAINRRWSVDAGLLYADGTSAFDDGPELDSRTALRILTAHAGIKGKLTQSWRTELVLSQGDDTANTIVAQFPGAFKTKESQWSWQNNVNTPLGLVLAGLEQRRQKVVASTAFAETSRTINSVFAGLSGGSGGHSWQLNARYDANSQFGHATTGFLGYGYRITPVWRVYASLGNSFVAPSFNQLYFPNFGNPNLQPERGRNIDLGLTWSDGGHEVKVVRFVNKIRGFITSAAVPANVPRARIDGWTVGYNKALGAFDLALALNALNPRNELTAKRLPRRAKQQLNAGFGYRWNAWRFGASLVHVGQRFDDSANTLVLPAYSSADLDLEWRFAKDWSAQAKLNNATNRHYETAFGYNQAGRSFYLTLRWQPR